MFEVEATHWWYVGLRAMLKSFCHTHVRHTGVRVLDVGCGTGAALDVLSSIGQPMGVDIAVDVIRLCRQRKQVRTAVASADALPFSAASFDAAVLLDVLSHRGVAKEDLALEEIRRVLKPGGVVLINLPAYQWLYSSHDVAVHTDHRFTRNEATALVRECGFEPLQATYWNTLLFPFALPVRLWRKLRPRRRSDIAVGSHRMTDWPLSKVLAFERQCLRVVPMPFGLSLFLAARKW